MKRTAAFCALAALLVACGDGNPFTIETAEPAVVAPAATVPGSSTPNPVAPVAEPDGTFTVPETVANDLAAFTFTPDPTDPTGGTLVVEGVFLDGDPLDNLYVRKPTLDVPGYVAFAAQDDALDQHTTAFAQDLNGTRGAVVVTGGQFGTFNGGATFARDGAFDPPEIDGTTGQVSYAGTYVGVTNLDGDPTDLLPVPAGTDPALVPGQAAIVTGEAFLNVDFADNAVNGVIFNRVLDLDDADEFGVLGGNPTLDVADLQLDPSVIDENGVFAGNIVEAGDPQRSDIGDYAGAFGGVDSEAVAGAIFVADHLLNGTTAEEEHGIFVLGRCGGPLETAAICASVDG